MYENMCASAEEAPAKIEELFGAMSAHRRTLVSILEMCIEPMQVDDVNAAIDRLSENGGSTYSPAALTRQLMLAGALELVGDTSDHQPDRITVDGVEYLAPARREPLSWHTTPAGREAARKADERHETERLLAGEGANDALFLKVLERCAESDASTEALQELVDGETAESAPKKYASRYTSRLKDAGAIEWRAGRWMATRAGKAALETEVL